MCLYRHNGFGPDPYSIISLGSQSTGAGRTLDPTVVVGSVLVKESITVSEDSNAMR